MKRKGNIYEKITDLNNIETAIYRASKGKGNRKSVEKILDSPTYYAMQVQQALINKTYVPNKETVLIKKKELFISLVFTQTR